MNSFLTEHELKDSYIILRNEIQKIAELSKKVLEFIKECKENSENINTLKITHN